MIKKALIVVAALTAIGVGTGFAATLSVGSHHLWAGTQSLTKSTCTVTTATDTYVDENKATTTNGSAATMSVQPDTSKRQYSLVSFDLSGCSLPTTAGADTATLKLVVTSAPNASRTLTVTPITSTWSGSTTWNTQPSYAATATTTIASGTTNGATLSIPVTIDVDGWIKGGTNYGWRIADLGTPASKDTTTFATTDATSNKPQLVINYEK
jgi:hypothetical protein